MKRTKLWIAVLVAGLTGLGASMLTVSYVGRPDRPVAQREGAAARVVVAARELPRGTYLTERHVQAVEWPAGKLPGGYFADADDVVGRGLVVDVAPNEPILASKLAPTGAGGGLPVVIPEGKRAVSVKVDEVVGVAGFVLPGTHVDVLVTLDPQTAEGRARPAATRVILQNVQVLASGQKIEKDDQGKPQTVTVITLLVTPEESEKLTLAATEGRIQMALRNVMDMDSITTAGIETGDLVRERGAAGPAPEAASSGRARVPVRVEVILGGKRKVEHF